MLLMLEDCPERLQRFAAVLAGIQPRLDLKVWRTAWSMIAEVSPYLSDASLISLDHDLDPVPGDDRDPGDGVMVAKFLVTQPIRRPVIIHSTNYVCARWMDGEFELEGWPHQRIAPVGDDWIETEWRYAVLEMLQAKIP